MSAAALYARVSSERQVQQATIDSQVTALKQRAEADGQVVPAHDVYVDAGFSGATLVRPALEQLRDRIAEGALEVLYVHSPDRLARKYAYQVLLLDEFRKRGVTTIFLHGPAGKTAEDELLVQVQGMIAEYERAKIMERSRRGKIHRARQGCINVLGGAPYGFLYVKKSDEAPASYRVLLPEAKVVRSIFDSLVHQQKSLRQIAQELSAQQVVTPGGARRWNVSTIRNILKNPAYIGKAAFGKTEAVESQRPLRPRRGSQGTPRRAKGTQRPRPPEEWIGIDVPSIVRRDVFEAAQEQLARNQRLSPRNGRSRHLLQGLSVCGKCGHAFYGQTTRRAKAKGGATYTYYRCMGSDAQRFAGEAICNNRPVRAQRLEQYVWDSVVELLLDPRRILDEWLRRRKRDTTAGDLHERREEAARQLLAHERSLQRLVDAYEVTAIDLQELKARSDAIRARIRRTQTEMNAAARALEQTDHLRVVVARVEDFADHVREGLDTLSWAERQQIIRALVAQVEVDENGATVVFRVPSQDLAPGADATDVQCSEPVDPGRGNSYGLRTSADRHLPPELHSQAAAPNGAPEPLLGSGRIEAHVSSPRFEQRLPG